MPDSLPCLAFLVFMGEPGDVVKLQIGQLSERMVIVNADTNRLLRINSACEGIPINIFASRYESIDG